MPNSAAKNASKGREDISQFVVHLTRDDRKSFTNGALARDNFLAILKSRKIMASASHCIFNARVAKLSDAMQKAFHTVCFTETPLNHLKQIVGEIPGRKIRLEAYGFVFLRQFLARSGGQPAIYVNSYEGNTSLREAVDELYSTALESGTVNTKLCRLLPLINAMHEKHDFSWEREWRIRRSLSFELSDLVCVILPEREDEIRESMAKAGIAAISPNWAYEQIVAELSRQQRATKSSLDKQLKRFSLSKQSARYAKTE